MDFNLYFDCIYCINLPYRTDRLKAFKQNCLAILDTDNVQIFKAIDGKEVKNNTWQHNSGALGCRLSHLAIYKEALSKKYSKILVLEDDVVFKTNLKKKFNKLLEYIDDDWDMIYFGGTNYLQPTPINKHAVKLNGTLSTHAIAINCKCLEKLILKIEHDQRWIDSVIGDLHAELKVYGFPKNIASQAKGYSDIQEASVNYNSSLYSKISIQIKILVKTVINYIKQL